MVKQVPSYLMDILTPDSRSKTSSNLNYFFHPRSHNTLPQKNGMNRISSLTFRWKEVDLLPFHPHLLLNKPAGPPLRPKSDQIISLEIGNMMSSHNFAHSIRSFFSVVEWNLGGMMVQDMSLDGAVHNKAADEAKITIDG
jgi:hypothetical protein